MAADTIVTPPPTEQLGTLAPGEDRKWTKEFFEDIFNSHNQLAKFFQLLQRGERVPPRDTRRPPTARKRPAPEIFPEVPPEDPLPEEIPAPRPRNPPRNPVSTELLKPLAQLPEETREEYIALLNSVPPELPNANQLVDYLYSFCVAGKRVTLLRQLRSVLRPFCAMASMPPTKANLKEYMRHLQAKATPASAQQQFGVVRKFLEREFHWQPEDFADVRHEESNTVPVSVSVSAPAPASGLGSGSGGRVRSPLTADDVEQARMLATTANGYPPYLSGLIGLIHQTRMKIWDILQLKWVDLRYTSPYGYFVIPCEGEAEHKPLPLSNDVAESLLNLKGEEPEDSHMFYFHANELVQHFSRLSQTFGKPIGPNELLTVARA